MATDPDHGPAPVHQVRNEGGNAVEDVPGTVHRFTIRVLFEIGESDDRPTDGNTVEETIRRTATEAEVDGEEEVDVTTLSPTDPSSPATIRQ